MTSLNETPRGERLHIGIFGRRNAGKSSLLNAITGQNAAIVSPVKGTTTDPVFKAMELLPIGPVVLIDTPGIDDYGELGQLRIEKTRNILRKTDIALLVVDSEEGLHDEDSALIDIFNETGVKYLIVYNRAKRVSRPSLPSHDRTSEDFKRNKTARPLPRGFNTFYNKSDASTNPDGICVNALTGENTYELKEKIAEVSSDVRETHRLVADLLSPGDVTILVIPVDKAAPKGRLILPQQQVIRDILDSGNIAIVARETELTDTLQKIKCTPKLVITDSQVFDKVSKETPENVGLTSFSILMARYKGVLEQAVRGAEFIDTIKDGDKILISEGCTHHRQCDDIGTVKLPRLIEKYTGAKPIYEFTSGGGFRHDLSDYKMIVHCGGCMLNAREMNYRHRVAKELNVPITNFGVAISHMQGILKRCISPFHNLQNK